MEDSFDKKTNTELEKLQELYNEMTENIAQIDQISKSISDAEASNDFDTLEELYQNEFMLYMDNISIFDDLANRLEVIDKTPENEFELARIRKGSQKMLRVQIVEVL